MRWPIIAGIGLVAIAGIGLVAWRWMFPSSFSVVPVVETKVVPSEGDAADDPAIWVHPVDPAQSLILGTDKEGGLAVYDLSGEELQYVGARRFNNVDLRDGFPLRGAPVSLVAAGDRIHEQVVLFRVDVDARQVVEIPGGTINCHVEPSGLCMYRSAVTGTFSVFVVGDDLGNDGGCWLEQWQLSEGVEVPIAAERVRRVEIESTSEGLAADDELGVLYLAEERVGVWKYFAEPGREDEPRLVDSVGWFERLRPDVEGIAIYQSGPDEGYLIVSSQGSNDFVVYRRAGENDYIGRFRIVAGNGLDRVTHTDGIEATSIALGPRFPAGLFVAQDDEDDESGQNFKLVPWHAIDTSLDLE